MTCAQGALKQDMTMTGTYDASNYEIHINSKAEVQPGMPMDMTMAITSKRTGDCTGQEDAGGSTTVKVPK